MEERREMNGQRMMTRDELEMRLPALNHIAEQRDAKFRLRYAEKTLNNGIERGYTLDAGTRVSVNVYQNESWVQMPDEELFDTLNDLDGRYCVTEDQETIGERLNAFFKSGELFEKIYPVVVSENNMESFAKAGITYRTGSIRCCRRPGRLTAMTSWGSSTIAISICLSLTSSRVNPKRTATRPQS